ncbi:histone deacetylase family protein [Amorphus coralli]|uniref:histone deacetylase family protein n=1 Tax=Amorphus coralli TaxID=340680 RepID=UPI000377883D|nr:histone deacetylase family protein [Amorphus coralli]
MKTVFSPAHARHHPHHEISDGTLKPAVEIPSRAEMVLAAIEAAGLGEILPPEPIDRALLERIHDPAYVAFLETVWDAHRAAGRAEDEAFPFVWPTPGLRPDRAPRHLDGRMGFYSFDAGTPLTAGTFEAALASASVAVTGAGLIAAGERSAFALCRPPGHHAMADRYGGYCFFNNAALAAERLVADGRRVAILDVDYHHGNGTQAIFYDRGDVHVVSIHADPDDEYPYFLGHADEIGEGHGEGANLNLPLALGADWPVWSQALEIALGSIERHRPDAVVVSLGLDPYEADPISHFRLTSDDFSRLGARLGRIECPVLFVLEGGYAVEALGANCAAVLTAFEGG